MFKTQYTLMVNNTNTHAVTHLRKSVFFSSSDQPGSVIYHLLSLLEIISDKKI